MNKPSGQIYTQLSVVGSANVSGEVVFWHLSLHNLVKLSAKPVNPEQDVTHVLVTFSP